MLALIDGDLITYRCAAVTEKVDVNIARWQADETLSRILNEVDADDWKIYLSGDNNFRYQLYPDYKANRRDMVRPKHLEPLREHLILEWDAYLTDGYEADDALGITSQSSETPECVVCSIDKDLRQVPGNHYHFVNRTWDHISSIDGWRNFYAQVLCGDTSDNISGCPGIGLVKSARAVEYATQPSEMYEICAKLYTKAKVSIEQMHLNAQLLYILRAEGDRWIPPNTSKQEEEVKQSSLPNLTENSSEPTKA